MVANLANSGMLTNQGRMMRCFVPLFVGFYCCLAVERGTAYKCSANISQYKGRVFDNKKINSTDPTSSGTVSSVHYCRDMCFNGKNCIAISYNMSKNAKSNCRLYNLTNIQSYMQPEENSIVILFLPKHCGKDSAVDGGWSSWQAVGECSSTCGLGQKNYTRNCTEPTPFCNGNKCSGLDVKTGSCQIQNCTDLTVPDDETVVVPLPNTAVLDCTASCSPDDCTPLYSWTSGHTTSNITISSIKPTDNGNVYTCVVSHPYALALTATVHFSLLVLDVIVPENETVPLPLGGSAVFDCSAACSPGDCTPSYVWSSGETSATKTVPSVTLADDGDVYTCTVSHPDDLSMTATVTFTFLVPYAAGVFQEMFTGIRFASLGLPQLFNDPSYVNGQPDSVAIFQLYDTGNIASHLDSFGLRLKAFYKATMSGNHTFFASGDEFYQLEVSDKEHPENGVIAEIYCEEWTYRLEWDRHGDQQQSSPVYLTEGRLYLLVAHLVENLILAHVSIGVQLPDGLFDRPISSNLFYDLRWQENE